MKLIIVSGRSGSGKSVALRVLEDLGYYCVDNLPPALLPELLETTLEQEQLAVSIDVRNLPRPPSQLAQLLDSLQQKVELQIMFLDAADSVLLRRFSETRRLHPLLRHAQSIPEAIALEQQLLSPLIERADNHIDTTELSVHQLADQVRERLLGRSETNLVLMFVSFGFKYGLPQDADYVFDARFLPNPHWEPELKPLTGLDEPVKRFLRDQPIVAKFICQIENLLMTWLPHLERNNRNCLTIAIGCTGGQHRSVFIAEQLAQGFRRLGKDVRIRHREQERIA